MSEGTSSWYRAPLHMKGELGHFGRIHPKFFSFIPYSKLIIWYRPLFVIVVLECLEVFLEPKLGFTLVVHLFDRFCCAFGILHTLFTIIIVLFSRKHKFDQCLKDSPFCYHASSSDIYSLVSEAFLTIFCLGNGDPYWL